MLRMSVVLRVGVYLRHTRVYISLAQMHNLQIQGRFVVPYTSSNYEMLSIFITMPVTSKHTVLPGRSSQAASAWCSAADVWDSDRDPRGGRPRVGDSGSSPRPSCWFGCPTTSDASWTRTPSLGGPLRWNVVRRGWTLCGLGTPWTRKKKTVGLWVTVENRHVQHVCCQKCHNWQQT